MKVLIVDDVDTNRKLLRVNLEAEGIDTFEAADGMEALDKLKEETADVIISDILMPRMDGYRFCQEVRRNPKLESIPFIFYTSTYTSTGDEKLALDCGADRYIKKPAPLNVLMSAIEELVNPHSPRPRPAEMPEELLVMREYNAALVRKLEERNAKLEKAREEIMRVNEGLERRVEERTAELVQANQELEAFSHSIAHDLRSPLMAIDGFSHILLTECEGHISPTAMDHLRYISKATHQMHELTNDLLRLARASRAAIRREQVDMSILAGGILHDLRDRDPGREVSALVTGGLLVDADLALLRIALENLLNNSWKFTRRTPNPQIEVGVTGRRTYFVRDNGAGFDMASVGRLFNAFERLHSPDQFPGTGIGLTTVQRIIRRHGGFIRAEGTPGKGATFFFDLGPPDQMLFNSES
ncbi:MAG TPA: response regulator [Chthoniobacteraceae bacterium]|jgi:signal transduction histidine kinase|nr:response regulator [Chthoniobacteraceae bacterium]